MSELSRVRRAFDRSVETLVRMIQDRTPGMVLGRQVGLIMARAFILFPAEMTEALAEPLIAVFRQRSALCRRCDNGIPAADSRHRICSTCEAEDAAIGAEYDAALEKLDPELLAEAQAAAELAPETFGKPEAEEDEPATGALGDIPSGQHAGFPTGVSEVCYGSEAEIRAFIYGLQYADDSDVSCGAPFLRGDQWVVRVRVGEWGEDDEWGL